MLTQEFQTRMSGAMKTMLVLTGIILVVCLIAAILVAGAQSDLEVPVRGVLLLIWVFPLTLLLVLLNEYCFVRVREDQVQLRGLFRQLNFRMDAVTGYAVLEERGREFLWIEIRERRQPVRFIAQYYRNYAALKSLLTQHAKISQALELAQVRSRARMVLILLALGLLACLVIVIFLQAAYEKPPLAERDLQKIEGRLLEDPALQTGRKADHSNYIRLAIRLAQLPDVSFQLENAALAATDTRALQSTLKAGDKVSLWMKNKRSGRLSGMENIYALRGKGIDFLTLEAYNRQHKANLKFTVQLLRWSVLVFGVFVGWKYWVYLNR